MKVLGRISDKKIICEVDVQELQKYFNSYFWNAKVPAITERGVEKMIDPSNLVSGDILNLGLAYDHSKEIQEAMKTTQKLIDDNKKVVEAIINGLRVESVNKESQP